MKKITIEINTETHELVLSMGAMMRYEDKTGINTLTSNPLRDMNITRSLTMIWACMGKKTCSQIQPEDIGDMMPLDRVEEVINKCGEIYEQQMPKGDADKKKQAGK